ncbi:hypothetical protein [Dactylosporangium sp. CA-233914]|uniref:hypothetical protein n=1 Tax=Dactylosporangium sp. CA-233914 TaxID=3239934 RepID=UPI003D8E683E
MAVPEGEWDLFTRAHAAGRLPLAPADIGPALGLTRLRAVHVRFPPGAPRRAALRALRHGDDAELRMLLDLAIRRVPVPAGAPPAVARCVAHLLGRAWRTLALLGLPVAAVARLLGGDPAAVLAAALTPAAVAVTLALHEAAHLIALRRRTGHPRTGALLIGPWHLAVIRPDLTGAPLRWVAATGPLTGAAAALPLTVAGAWQPWLFAAGIAALAVHLANLWPTSVDGRQLWRGLA